MERNEVLEIMRRKAVDLLEVKAEDVQPERSFVDDLQVDSLSLVEYTMDLEDELDIALPEDELTDLKTIGAFLDLIVAKLAAKGVDA
ncbi:MAG: acyl carrier protein [Actinobacteria bacterium]|nr:acyl carrier protein [Actinomycetota bacterium]MCA1721116.1 acyl carrier protein [Actinomycetota bacterium]